MSQRSTRDPVRRAHLRRLELAFAAGMIAIVAGGLETASADTQKPHPDPVQVVHNSHNTAAGGRLTFR